MDDPYATAVYRWWHLSSPSPELVAAEAAGQLGGRGIAVDLGCGLGSELAYLTGRGWKGLGIDILATPLARARELHPGVNFIQADVMRLPLPTGAADLILDRGCFHYLDATGRADYAREAARVLRLGGRLLLRMCLNSGGVPNGLNEGTIVTTFDTWRITSIERVDLVTDSRSMPAVIAVLVRSASIPG